MVEKKKIITTWRSTGDLTHVSCSPSEVRSTSAVSTGLTTANPQSEWPQDHSFLDQSITVHFWQYADHLWGNSTGWSLFDSKLGLKSNIEWDHFQHLDWTLIMVTHLKADKKSNCGHFQNKAIVCRVKQEL